MTVSMKRKEGFKLMPGNRTDLTLWPNIHSRSDDTQPLLIFRLRWYSNWSHPMEIDVIQGNSLAALACDYDIKLFFLRMSKFLYHKVCTRATCWEPAPARVSWLSFLSVAKHRSVELQSKSLGWLPSNLLIVLFCCCCYCSCPSEIPTQRDQLTYGVTAACGPPSSLENGMCLLKTSRVQNCCLSLTSSETGPGFASLSQPLCCC